MYKMELVEGFAPTTRCRGSTWNIYPQYRESRIWKFVEFCSPCRHGLFPYIFWVVLTLSVVGFVLSLDECLEIYYCPHKPLRMWRPRKFYVFNLAVIRIGRLAGAIISCYVWFLMLYGVIYVKPYLIMTWIMLNSTLLVLDFGILLSELLTNSPRQVFTTICQQFCLMCSLILVNCVKAVFQDSIENHKVDSMRIFGRNSFFTFIISTFEI